MMAHAVTDMVPYVNASSKNRAINTFLNCKIMALKNMHQFKAGAYEQALKSRSFLHKYLDPKKCSEKCKGFLKPQIKA